MKAILIAPLLVASVLFAGAAQANPALAEANCGKCHEMDKKKKGPAYKVTAAKWKGKADAEAKLIEAITKAPKVKLEDGTQEDHKVIATKDMAEIKNVVAWILAQ